MVPKFKKIVVFTDCSDTANNSVKYAYSIADSGGEVYIVHVIEHQENVNTLYAHYNSDDLYDPEKRKAAVADVIAHLEELVPKTASEKSIQTHLEAVFHAEVDEGISAEINQRKPDAVVIGSHGRTGLKKLLMGSIAEKVMKHCTVPLLIVPHKD